MKVLLKAGNEVKVIDNLATGRESNLETVKSDFEMRKVDIRDFDSLSKLHIQVLWHYRMTGGYQWALLMFLFLQLVSMHLKWI